MISRLENFRLGLNEIDALDARQAISTCNRIIREGVLEAQCPAMLMSVIIG